MFYRLMCSLVVMGCAHGVMADEYQVEERNLKAVPVEEMPAEEMYSEETSAEDMQVEETDQLEELPQINEAKSQSEWGVAAKIGTPGFGLEASYDFASHWGARFGFNTFDIDFDEDVDGINYDGDLELNSFSILVDWYPKATNSGFRVTGGLLINNNEVNATATNVGTIDVNGTTYTPAEVGSIDANLDYDSPVPYLGVGFRSGANRSGSLQFIADLGVIFQGEGDAELTATGGAVANPIFQDDIQAEEDAFQEDLDDFDLYPVASIGLRYAF